HWVGLHATLQHSITKHFESTPPCFRCTTRKVGMSFAIDRPYLSGLIQLRCSKLAISPQELRAGVSIASRKTTLGPFGPGLLSPDPKGPYRFFPTRALHV